MWLAILTTLYFGGFLFYLLATCHKHLQRGHFSFIPHKLKVRLGRLKLKCFRTWNQSKIAITHHEANDIDKMKAENNMLREDTEGIYLFEDLQNSILYTYGMLTLVSLPKVPSGWAIRMMTGWWWLYCLLVVVSYRASMTASLANPPPKVTIDTLQELALSHVQCSGWSANDKEFFTKSLDREAQKVGLKFFVLKDIYSALSKVTQGSMAYYENIYFLQNARINLWRKSNINNTLETKQKKNLHIMSECIIKMPIAIGLERNSPLKNKFDSLLQRLVEAGLIKKWLDDVLLSTLSAELLYNTDEIKALMDLKKLYGGLVAICIGYTISTIVIIVEVLYWKYRVVKHPLFDRYNTLINTKKPTIKI